MMTLSGMILASSNQKVFSAGLDLMEMYQPQVRPCPPVLKTHTVHS